MASIKLMKAGDFSGGTNGASGHGAVDVVGSYRWSASKVALALEEVPRIIITEYQQNLSSIAQGVDYWANQGKTFTTTGKTADPYAGLYTVNQAELGNTYTFPFYEIYHHSVQQSWGENKGGIPFLGKVKEFAQSAARAVFPSAGIETAKTFEGTGPVSYSFTFHLFNTVDPSTDIQKNKDLIRMLINNNLADKVDFLVIRPPAICEVEIPGMRGKTVGVMSNIAINKMGQINYMNGENIPDAYAITISIQELLTESRQIWGDQLKNSKVFTMMEGGGVGLENSPQQLKNTLTQLVK